MGTRTGRRPFLWVAVCVALACVSAAAAGLVPAAVAAHQESWVPAPTLSLGAGADASSLELGVGAAVWLSRRNGAPQVLYSELDGSGDWTAPVALSSSGAAVDHPSIATDHGTVVAWRIFDGEHWRAQARVRLPDASWSVPTTFTSVAGDATDPLALMATYWDREVSRFPQVLWRQSDMAAPGACRRGT
jgi:hypothetical protein